MANAKVFRPHNISVTKVTFEHEQTLKKEREDQEMVYRYVG